MYSMQRCPYLSWSMPSSPDHSKSEPIHVMFLVSSRHLTLSLLCQPHIPPCTESLKNPLSPILQSSSSSSSHGGQCLSMSNWLNVSPLEFFSGSILLPLDQNFKNIYFSSFTPVPYVLCVDMMATFPHSSNRPCFLLCVLMRLLFYHRP